MSHDQAEHSYLVIAEFVRSRDPLLFEATSEVDQTLLELSLNRSARERLDSAFNTTRSLAALRSDVFGIHDASESR